MDPYRLVDADALSLAATLRASQSCALGTLTDGAPVVSRAACLWVAGVGLTLLVSSLSDHAKSLRADPRCSALLGDPGTKGDPLTHPRLTVRGRAAVCAKDELRTEWLKQRPKTKLYFDFADFAVWRIEVDDALLNGGFGKAYRLSPEDLERA
ncbi:pyridoxamine 5'-phosphate oxidase family protein [Jannaschia aquimarina]|uniref:Pyridoxamine 5'-phosphate oxidase N-terminal domain-containing protein n=1 Tax=Jannaschia aquimarina TaxID=935700 RepID=A0A0D1EJ64_9RHOB|nr:pyridoxamine 5'-phosphate oxidase family protein [Jannaschia aquimarina]KIT17669.1 hypothetical protein jaqu_05600 [Jannaschia aquimarina]SNS79484.1 hypothetical protein SAMN05421775_102321 [Jannaschia aquimarina]